MSIPLAINIGATKINTFILIDPITELILQA